MWKFGPDKIWKEKETLFIQTPKLNEDWVVRDFRKTQLRFRNCAYYPASIRETGKLVIYRFEPFDSTHELPGMTINYDEEYVKVRETNRKMPFYKALGVLVLASVLLFVWSVLKRDRTSVQLTSTNGSLISADGSTFNLSDFSEEYIWLDFSAPWCGPCRTQAPQMKILEDADTGVVFITIMVSDSGRRRPGQKTAQAWAKKFGLDPSMVLADTQGELSQDWGVRSIPLNILISPAGKVLYRQTGSHRASDMKSIIAKYL